MIKCIKTILYAANVNVLTEKELFEKAYKNVSEERKIKINRLHFDKDKRLSLGAEILLKQMLRDEGIEPSGLEIGFNENGKPYFKNCRNLNLSISHSNEYVLCAVSDREVGCDIEKIVDIDLNIAKRFFAHNEYKNITFQATKEEQNDLFFRYWTLKESFMKVTGLGMKLHLNSFEIVLGDLKISVIQNVDSQNYSFAEYDVIDGYKCALCTKDKKIDTKLDIINLAECI